MRMLLFLLCLPVLAGAQISFVKVTDPDNAITQQVPIPVYNGVSWMDYNDDGWEDLFINSNNLYKNLQDGTFEKVDFSPVNFGNGNGASWGDYDGDGDLDVIIAAAPTRLYRNDIDSFALVPITAEPIDTFNFWSAAWGDYDLDGWLDLALIHPAGFIPFTNPLSRPSLILKNDQNGSFTYVDTPLDDELAAHTIGTWTDFDLDGDLDLVIGSGEVQFLSKDHIFINKLAETGVATFERLTTGALAEDLRDGQNWNFIDYDLDGDLDAFVTNYTNNKANDLYRNNGNGGYNRQNSLIVGSIANQPGFGLNNIWADFDNDGFQDCIVIFDGEQDRYYHNNGNGTFSEQNQPFTIAANTRGGAAGDYDNDGFMDLMISAISANAVGLYHNQGNDNNWFHLRLQGNAPNTAAIGAKVRLKANINGNDLWQFREVNAQNTFNGHNSLRVHFGLSQATIIDTLEVIWPDGSRQVAINILPNQECEWPQGSAAGCGTTVAIDEVHSIKTNLELFPNPVKSDVLHFRSPFKDQGTTRWRIFNSSGMSSARLTGLLREGPEGGATIDISNLPAGTYIIELSRNGAIFRDKFIRL